LVKHDEVEQLERRALELSFLEDAYISSRHLLRQFGEEEYRRVRAVVEEVMSVLVRRESSSLPPHLIVRLSGEHGLPTPIRH
jgi:hypothetical protein